MRTACPHQVGTSIQYYEGAIRFGISGSVTPGGHAITTASLECSVLGRDFPRQRPAAFPPRSFGPHGEPITQFIFSQGRMFRTFLAAQQKWVWTCSLQLRRKELSG